MTKQEIKSKIAEAAVPEWFKTVETSFNFPYTNESRTIKGVSAIFEYVEQQIEGWKVYGELPTDLKRSPKYFVDIKNQLIQFVNTHFDSTTNTLKAYWQSLVVNTIANINSKPIQADSPYADFLFKIWKNKPDYFLGAYKHVIKSDDYNTNNRNFLTGALMAYEFELKDQTDIISRRDSEKKSIAQLRNEFTKYLSESEAQVIDHLKNLSTQYDDYVKKIDTLKNEKELLFQKWFDNTKDEKWQKWIEPTIKTVSELEETYKQKLKLEEPAMYWSDRAKKLNRHGWLAMVTVIILVSITAWSLGKILWNSPDQIYSSWFSGDKSAAIRWSIVYVTLISFVAFCIKSITKVMFSSFHLARDCEERYTLTYFYLSLLKDSKVDEKDRQLIIQSLFSRAETGLLKDDSSPTMPNDAIGKFISNK
ncbi:MAG: DUF6161 domain-containing protein [Bacteroidota bacterium]